MRFGQNEVNLVSFQLGRDKIGVLSPGPEYMLSWFAFIPQVSGALKLSDKFIFIKKVEVKQTADDRGAGKINDRLAFGRRSDFSKWRRRKREQHGYQQEQQKVFHGQFGLRDDKYLVNRNNDGRENR